MTPITIKDSANVDTVFNVVRQPGGNSSAMLQATVTGTGMNRTAYPKVEVHQRVNNGRTEPVVSVVVPYGAVIDGNFRAEGSVTYVHQAKLPATAPDKARADAEAFARNVLANAQIMALFNNGVLA